MQSINENALKASFASQELKAELMRYIRESYAYGERQITSLKQWQALHSQWQEDLIETIDRNVHLARDQWKERARKRIHRQRKSRSESLEEESEDDSHVRTNYASI